MYGLGFLKSLFNFNNEKKAEKVMSKFGVFIRNAQNEGNVIPSCKIFLQDIKSDTKIDDVKRDEANNGLAVFFNCGSGIAELLKKKYLNQSESGGLYTIHSLDTVLSIHDAFPTDVKEFKNFVRSQIENLSSVPVVRIEKVPFSKSYPDIGSGKWIITLDVPEVEDLDVFKVMGLPENMKLEDPANGKQYRVTFHCRICQQDEHIQFRCLNGVSNVAHPSSTSSAQSRSLNTSFNRPGSSVVTAVPAVPISNTSGGKIETSKRYEKPKLTKNPQKKFPSPFRVRDPTEERAEPIPNSPSVLDKIKAFERRVGTEEVQRHFGYLAEDSIKKEKVEETPSISSQMKRQNVEMVNEFPQAKRPCTYPDSNRGEPHFSGERSISASSTTTEKDSVEIIFESKSRFQPGCSQNPPDNSPVVTTSHQQPDAALISTEEEDSNPAPIVRQRKKAAAMLPVVIPDSIRAIIAEMPDKVLDVKLLEAFFSHVKKKARPAEFARMYTDDVEGLLEQMKEISRRYYMRPVVGSNEDLKFVKMLVNIVQRFHKMPVKRKREIKEEVEA